MTLANRHLPWALAVVGAIHGWFAGNSIAHRRLGSSFQPTTSDEPLPILLALVFAAILFIGAWSHISRPQPEHKNLWSAAGRLLLTGAAFGLAPAAICLFFGGWSGLEHGLEKRVELGIVGLGAVSIFVLPALPPALLLIYGVTRSVNPRRGSILAGVDSAEHALAALSAVALLPWWRSDRPAVVASLLALMALPAIAIGLHAVALARQVKGLRLVFGNASPTLTTQYGAFLAWDIGLGGQERSLSVETSYAYRNAARPSSAACWGSPVDGIRAARRLMAWSLLVCVVALAHAGAILMRA